MSRSNRLSYVAIGRCVGIVFLALATFANAQPVGDDADTQPGPDQGQGAISEETNEALTAINESIERLTSATEAVGADPYAEQDQQRADDDLIAQQGMAKWAYWMFAATAFMTAFTFAGVVLIGFTLCYTKQAAKYAGSAAQAGWAAVRASRTSTKETIRHMAKHSRRELRAYLSIRKAKITDVEIGKKPVAKVTIWNAGQTPAYDLTAKLAIGLLPVPTTENDFSDAFKGGELSRATIGPQQRITPSVPMKSTMEEKHISALRDGRGRIFVLGRIEFTDAFGHKWFKNLRLMYTDKLIEAGSNRLAVCEAGNDEGRIK